jgi:uncharacterized surface protein with fasciclin (FAS1) repeats
MKSNNNMMWIIGSVIAVVLVSGGLIASMGNNDDDASNNATSQSAEESSSNQSEAQSTIVELAQSTDSLSILVAAVVQAELVTTLNSEGPFTVFAPTNDAFAALLTTLGATTEELLAREDLGQILTYHVVSGKVMASDLSDGQVIKTVQGGDLVVTISDSGVFLTDANGNKSNVTATDIDASNGVVHLIDAVLLP